MTPDTLPAYPVNLTEAARLFRELGIDVHRSTLSRCADKYNLKRGNPNRPVVDVRALLAHWQDDEGRAIMAGEASGLTASRRLGPDLLSTPADTDTTAPAAQPEDRGDSTPDRLNPAVLLKHEQVRAQRRTNAEAEGALVPASEVTSAIVSAVGDLKTFLRQARRQTAEELAAELGLDKAQLPTVQTHLDRLVERALNGFNGAMLEAARAAEEPTNAVRQRLAALEAHDAALREGPADRAA